MRMSKSERQAKLLQLIREADISTQEELVVAFNKIGLKLRRLRSPEISRSWASLKLPPVMACKNMFPWNAAVRLRPAV